MTEPHILHIDTHSIWRGGQRQALQLMKELSKRGVKNYLACRENSEIGARARKLGIDVVNFKLRGEWDVFSASKIRTFIQKHDINIVHTHTSHAHMIGLLALVRYDRCKLIVSRRVDFHIHNTFSLKVKYGSRVDRIITVSEAVRRILIEDGIDPDRIVTIRSGFIRDSFDMNAPVRDLRSELGIDAQAPVIATVAALAPHKAHHVLLKAAHIVQKSHPDAVFLFAGDGELREDIEKHIRNLDLQNSVKLLGFVDDVQSVYACGDIFALSSREEALCSSLFDAMYFKMSIVATSAGGIPEIVKDGVNGYIVPVDDHVSFAERLNYLIEHADIRSKMGDRSEGILRDNTIDCTVEATLSEYHQVLSSEEF